MKRKTKSGPVPAETRERVAALSDTQLLDELARLGPGWVEEGEDGFDVYLTGLDLVPDELDFETRSLAFRDAIRAAILTEAYVMGVPEHL